MRDAAVETEAAAGAWVSNATIAGILPPDIYMSLKFPDHQQQQQQQVSGGGSSSRAFLNVVDINSAEMLASIVDTVPERDVHEVKPHSVDMSGAPIQPRAHLPGARTRTPEARARSASPRRPGADRLTSELLLGQPEPGR